MRFWGVLVTLLVTPQQTDPAAMLQEAGKLQAAFKEEEALRLYENVLARDPAQLDALVGASWLSSKLSTYRPVGDQKRDLCAKALSLAQRAYEQDPDHPEVNLVMASATGNMALLSGVKERARGALDMKNFLDRAVAGNPQDARAWYMLGHWRYRVASASALERAGAKLIGVALPDVSMADARDAYREAVLLDPESIIYRWEFAQALEAVGNKEEAIEQLRAADKLEPKTPRDPGMLAQLRYRLKKLTKN